MRLKCEKCVSEKLFIEINYVYKYIFTVFAHTVHFYKYYQILGVHFYFYNSQQDCVVEWMFLFCFFNVFLLFGSSIL